MRLHRSAGSLLAAALFTLAGLIAIGGFIDLFAKPPPQSSRSRTQADKEATLKRLRTEGLFTWPLPTATAVSWEAAAQNRAVAAWNLALTPTAPPPGAPLAEVPPAPEDSGSIDIQPSDGGAPPVPAYEPPPDYQNYDMASAVLSYVNGARASHGLGGLSANGALSAAAANYAQYLSVTNLFTHDALGGLLARVQASGYGGGYVGETLWEGWGSFSASDVVNDWLNSPSHRKILLTGIYREAGVACYAIGDNTRCVLDVGAR